MMHWKRPLTSQYQTHINFPASASVPFFLSTTMPPWARGNSSLWGVYRNCQEHVSHPLECTRWCIRCHIFLPKFPQGGWSNLLCYMSFFSSLIWLPPSPAPHHSLCKRTPTGRTIFYSWSRSDVFTFCLCVSYRHKKLQCFPAHHMHPTKISVHGAVIPFFVEFLFHGSDNGFWPSGLLQAIENKGMFCREQWCFGKKREVLRWLISLFYTL